MGRIPKTKDLKHTLNQRLEPLTQGQLSSCSPATMGDLRLWEAVHVLKVKLEWCNWQNQLARMRLKQRESQINKRNEFPTKRTELGELLKDTLQKHGKGSQKVSNVTGAEEKHNNKHIDGNVGTG